MPTRGVGTVKVAHYPNLTGMDRSQKMSRGRADRRSWEPDHTPWRTSRAYRRARVQELSLEIRPPDLLSFCELVLRSGSRRDAAIEKACELGRSLEITVLEPFDLEARLLD